MAWSPRRSRSMRLRCRRPRCRPPCVRGWRGRPRCATIARRACCAAAGSPIWICWRSGRGTARPRRMRSIAPGSAAAVAAVLAACAEEGVAVVPFGGGTSVVGGLAGERGGFGSLVSLDLGQLDRLISVDPRSRVAVFEPGIRLPEADAALRVHGLALGHVPQSYEWATVGGCAATRSAGQSSTGHGRIDAQVVALECVTPVGVAGDVGCARDRCGSRVAAAGAGLRGGVRRDHTRRAARPAVAGRGVRRLDGGLVPRGRRRAAPARAGLRSRRTSPGSPTRRRRG